jgi:acetyl esterase/lipase
MKKLIFGSAPWLHISTIHSFVRTAIRLVSSERMEVLNMMGGHRWSQMLPAVAGRYIKDGSMPAVRLAEAAGRHEETLHLLLTAIAGRRIFKEGVAEESKERNRESGRRRGLVALISIGLAATSAVFGQAAHEVEFRSAVPYATHDGVTLTGDYYVPRESGRFPVVIAIHGGAWHAGDRTGYKVWGPYLAQRGIALFSIDYRLSKPGLPSYPKPVQDVRAAIQFVRYKADELKVDANRVALLGDSSGAQLGALAALAGDIAPFANAYPADPYAAVSTKVRAVVGIYGVYDMVHQWSHDLVTRPSDQITVEFLGTSPMDNRKVFFDASPISYAIRSNNQISFFLSWGTADDIASPSQSEEFLLALKQARFYVRTAPVPGAVHFWVDAPIEEPGSATSFVCPQVARFLKERL